MSVERALHQKHLGILNFKMHIDTVLCKVNEEISMIKTLRHTAYFTKKVITYYLQSVFETPY